MSTLPIVPRPIVPRPIVPRPIAPVVESILELIGQTPLVRLNRVVGSGASIYAKCEHLNPGGSIKDRICQAMLEDAASEGRLKRGDTVVEPTSGNTGIGLAIYCARQGYKLVLTMPESMSLERRQLLEAYGVELVLTPAEQVMEGAIEAATRIAEERKAYMPEQFRNPSNPNVHAHSTAQELLILPRIDAFIAAVGTGGTISGIGAVLKKERNTQIIAVEPQTSPVLSGGKPGPSKIQGINAGFIPKNFDPSVVDKIITVSDRAAYDMKQRLAKEEGLLVGMSAGANIEVARQVAMSLPSDAVVATILCDTGERYFSLDEYFE